MAISATVHILLSRGTLGGLEEKKIVRLLSRLSHHNNNSSNDNN
eukprot:CAMPEP_0115096482 /NCGR_PEP_ID=MMETSP0227-20121206/29755_1 /TAXON_ID=89957 /ORGANISM="Polarella glacialis, Strain CCMP 1383" /LENGTH=43 /DNA_ID= /DNA_START= /DNA_END= /DNA_ORIENTATION=